LKLFLEMKLLLMMTLPPRQPAPHPHPPQPPQPLFQSEPMAIPAANPITPAATAAPVP
jgi:hypothetical protein